MSGIFRESRRMIRISLLLAGGLFTATLHAMDLLQLYQIAKEHDAFYQSQRYISFHMNNSPEQ